VRESAAELLRRLMAAKDATSASADQPRSWPRALEAEPSTETGPAFPRRDFLNDYRLENASAEVIDTRSGAQ
jgi:hypothetical protein